MTQNVKDAKKGAKSLAKSAKGTVHLALLLDESGSMSMLREEMVNGVHEFLTTFAEEKNADVKVWIATFDAQPGEPRTRVVVKGKSPSKVKFTIEDYNPRGMTPLNDAIMDTINAMNKRVGDDRAFVAILTDGLENASETTPDAVAKAIKKHEKGGWGFVYVGMGHDVKAATESIGLRATQGFHTNNITATAGWVANNATMYLNSASSAEYQEKTAREHARSGGDADAV